MAKFSEKVIEHLRFAKNWLDRAEEEYSNEQILEAELTLSLAEAEVRHAWETSRGSETSTTLRLLRLWRKRLVVLVIAGALVSGGYYYYQHWEPGYPDNQYQLGQSAMPGQWERNIEYKLVIQASPQPAQPDRPAPPVVQATQLAAPVESINEQPKAEVTVPEPEARLEEQEVKTPEPIVIAESTESGEVTEALEPVKPTKTAELKEQPAEAESGDPPELNLGELFQVANNALNGE